MSKSKATKNVKKTHKTALIARKTIFQTSIVTTRSDMAHFETRDGMKVAVKENGKPFRILQLTDVHIGGSLGTRKKDRLALEAVEKIVGASGADMIVVTGDMVYPCPFSIKAVSTISKQPKCLATSA